MKKQDLSKSKWRDNNRENIVLINKSYYAKNRPALLIKNKEKYKKRRAVINAVKVTVGCQNPQCEWSGQFLACDLDFHHLDKNQKEQSIAKLIGCSPSKIASEINRCTVLCAICHRRATYDNLDCCGLPTCKLSTEEIEKLNG